MMSQPDHSVQIAQWKDDKRFAYSITYDEGLVETLGFARRIHHRYGIPGHINAFPEMLGKLVGDTSAGFLQSLWNLQKYADPEHLQFMMSEGWSVGCQISSSGDGNQAPSAASLLEMRLSLEKAIGCSVRSLAFSDYTYCETVQDVAQEAGFHWLFALYDDLNSAGEDASIIKRSPLYHQSPVPLQLGNDPYRLLALGQDQGAWVVDVVRRVDLHPLDASKDCTLSELEARFKAVHRIGKDRVWTALPETIAGYRALRLSTQIKHCTCTPDQIAYTLAVTGPGDSLTEAELTFVARLPATWLSPRAVVGEDTVNLQPGPEAGTWLFTHRVREGLQVRLANNNGMSV
ncbi:MAG: hypothetical protein U9R25_09635 [Chloroflexota bacterium]|nr:hypothetical protein [Chloroflexota bacterium]